MHLAAKADVKSLWSRGGLSWKELLRRIGREFIDDRILDQSAKLAFYFLLSLFPLMLFLVALLGLFAQLQDSLRETLVGYLSTIVPASASSLVDRTLAEITRSTSPVRLSVALLFTWWSASQGMLALVEGLNVAYEARESRSWWKKYLLASGLTLASLVLAAMAVLVLRGGDGLSHRLAAEVGAPQVILGVWRALRALLLLGFVLMGFNILYVFAPNLERRRWHWLMPGTVVGVLLWLAVSFGFKLYLTFFDNFNLVYGSIGAMVILMIWLSLSGVAILVGAEVNSEVEKAVANGRKGLAAGSGVFRSRDVAG